MIQLENIQTEKTALLMMHYQADVFKVLADHLPDDMLERANTLVQTWRQMGGQVVFANLAFGANYEAVHPHNLLTLNVSKAGIFREANPQTVLKFEPQDWHYSCPRASVFYGTSLDNDLRARGIDTLVMAGIASSGVLFSSVAWASDADYQLYLMRDCCFDPDTQAHEALFRTSFATRAKIL